MARRTITVAAAVTVATGHEDNGSVVVRNPTGGNDVYLDVGNASVSSTTGFLVAATQSVTVPLGQGQVLYGRANGGDQEVHILASNVKVAS